MNMKSLCAALCAAAALLLVTAQADQVYRWVDKDGQVHYSQTPPAGSAANPQVVDIQVPPPDPTAVQQTRDLEKSVNAQDQAQQKVAENAQQQAEQQAQQQQRCAAARKQLQEYMDSHRVITNPTNGPPQYYTGEDLIKFRQQAQEQVNKVCGGS